ncbi:MAG TPA: nucleotidyltransferase domain-containing protein [Polyangia bacterium]|jgi:predicted nucleotidyltransferase
MQVSDAIRAIVREAARSLVLRRALLFGSRARGDAQAASDVDLAFEHDSTDAAWADFVNRMADEAPTLRPVDLVDLRRAIPALRERILREGLRVDA